MSSSKTDGVQSEQLNEASKTTDSFYQTGDRAGQITEQYFANAYQRGFQQTVRFLLSRGIPRDVAFDTAQGAWTKAWERRAQLRNPTLVLTWVNSIALNVYRTALRRQPQTEALVDLQGPGQEMDGASIDAERILSECKPSDRIVLEGHYICGYRLEEIAAQNNWSETAVRIRLLRARRKVRRLLTRNRKVRLLTPRSVTTAAPAPLEVVTQAA